MSFREAVNKLRHWVEIHPLTVLSFSLMIATVIGMTLFATEVLKLGGQIQQSKIPNPFTFNQLTGLVIIILAFCLLLLALFFYLFSSRVIETIQEKEDMKASVHAQEIEGSKT